MTDQILRAAVVFAILMQNNDGILGKAPMYVLEKWHMVREMEERGSDPANLLDSANLAKLKAWEKRWLRR